MKSQIIKKVEFWNYLEKNFFDQKNYGEVALNWRTNDQIMSRFWRSFINDRCIFQ